MITCKTNSIKNITIIPFCTTRFFFHTDGGKRSISDGLIIRNNNGDKMVLSAKMNPLHRNRHLFKHILLLAFPFLISTHLNLYEKIMIRSQPLHFLYTPLQYRNTQYYKPYILLVLPLGLQISFLMNTGIRYNFSSFNLKRGQKYGLSVNIYIRIQTLTTSVTFHDYYWLQLTLQTV